VLGKPNKKQSKVRNNTYTQSRDVGTFNISYGMIKTRSSVTGGIGRR